MNDIMKNGIFIVVIVAVFYFLIIKPQQTRQKQQSDTMRTLAPGVEIVTIGGIYGTIISVGEDRVRLSVADGSELEVAKRAIGQVVPVNDDEDADGEDSESADEIDVPTDETENAPAAADDEADAT